MTLKTPMWFTVHIKLLDQISTILSLVKIFLLFFFSPLWWSVLVDLAYFTLYVYDDRPLQAGIVSQASNEK